MNIPTALTSPPSCIPLIGEHMLLPYVPLPNTGSSGKNKVESDDSGPFLLDYSNNQLAITSS